MTEHKITMPEPAMTTHNYGGKEEFFTATQAEAYAAAKVREALEKAARTAESHPNPYGHCQQSGHAADMTAVAIGKTIRAMIPKQ